MTASLQCNDCGTEYPRTPKHWHKNPARADGLSNICKPCACARTRDYCLRNREKVSEKDRIRRAANRDKAREYGKVYRAANAERLRKLYKLRYQGNREEVLARGKNRRIEHGDRINAERRAYRAAHPEKLREREKRGYNANRDRAKLVRAEWRKNNPEKTQAQKRRHYEANRDKLQAKGKKWVEANPEKAREIKRKHYGANTAKAIARAAKWRRDNPDKTRAHAPKSRARRALPPGSYTEADIQLQREKQNGLCFYCKRDISKKYHVDHYIPIAKGGTHDPSNIVLACPPCNVRKQAKLPHNFTPRA